MTRISEIIKNFNSISIPEYLLYEAYLENRNLIQTWIEYRKTNYVIPEELKYPGWQTDKNKYDQTMLMYGSNCRKN